MMKKVFWTVLAVLVLLGLCGAAGAEEIQVGQPFNVDIYLNEYVNARELEVSWREVKMAENSGFRFYEGAYATTDAGYQVQMRNGQTYLLSNGGSVPASCAPSTSPCRKPSRALTACFC